MNPYEMREWTSADGVHEFSVVGPGFPDTPDSFAGEMSRERCEIFILGMNVAFNEGDDAAVERMRDGQKDLYELWKEADAALQESIGLLEDANSEIGRLKKKYEDIISKLPPAARPTGEPA